MLPKVVYLAYISYYNRIQLIYEYTEKAIRQDGRNEED